MYLHDTFLAYGRSSRGSAQGSHMAVITKPPSGKYRAPVRRQGVYRAQSFSRKKAAPGWAVEIERAIESGSSRWLMRAAAAYDFEVFFRSCSVMGNSPKVLPSDKLGAVHSPHRETPTQSPSGGASQGRRKSGRWGPRNA